MSNTHSVIKEKIRLFIKDMRISKNMSQLEFDRFVGFPEGYTGKLEMKPGSKNARSPGLETLDQVLTAFGMPIDAILSNFQGRKYKSKPLYAKKPDSFLNSENYKSVDIKLKSRARYAASVRNKKLTPEQRHEIAKKAIMTRWHGIRVLVCGARHYDDKIRVFRELDKIRKAKKIHVIIEGGARGADSLARQYAKDKGIQLQTFRTDWKTHGKAAKPIRNQTMIDEGNPDLVIVFSGGRYAADLIAKAKDAKIKVFEVMG